MANTVVPQPQIAPEPAAPDAPQVSAAPVPNDQAAAAAGAGRRRAAAAAVPAEWKAALGPLLPPEALGPAPTVTLQVPPLPDFRRAMYKLAVHGVKGATETQTYLYAADANQLFTSALSDVLRAATTDKEAFQQLRMVVDTVVHGGDLDRASLDTLRLLALTTEDGKIYLRSDDRSAAQPIAAPLVGYIARTLPSPSPKDTAATARKTTLNGLVHAIHDPHSAARDASTAGPAAMTATQVKATEALIARIKVMFPPGQGLAANATAAQVAAKSATPAQMDALTTAINGAEPRVQDAVYAWRDNNGQGVLDLLHNFLTPTQMEQTIGVLDPVARVYKQLVDVRNGMGAAGATEYQVFHDFCALHLNDEPIRNRAIADAPLMQQFYQSMTVPNQRVIMRMLTTGHEAPDAVDRVHAAADAGDSNAAVAAIIELGSTPTKLQQLRADLAFTHRLQDKCNARVAYQGIPIKPYDLFLRMCGADPNAMHEAGSLAKQTEVNPSPTPELPLNPAERAKLDAYVYEPFKLPLANELNSYWFVRDSTVMNLLFSFESRCAQPEYVALLRRAHEAPGPELARRVQAAGCDVRLKCQRGLDGDNLIQAERILGFVADQAAVGVIGGNGALASDYKGSDGKGVVPLPQALREMLVNGQVLSQIIRDKAAEMDTAIRSWFWKADHAKTVWRDYRKIVTDSVCADLRTRTGLPRVWPIELMSNAYLQIGGNSLQAQLQYEFGADPDGVLAEMGMRAGDIDSRKQLAATDFKQQQNAAANAAAEDAAHKQVESARQVENFRAPSDALFKSLATLGPYVGDDVLRGIGHQLSAGLHMAAVAAPPAQIQVGPVAAPSVNHDPGARPGGPVHPGDGPALDFKSFYKREHGIDPTRHAVEVAKAMANPERPAAKIGQLFGVTAADLRPRLPRLPRVTRCRSRRRIARSSVPTSRSRRRSRSRTICGSGCTATGRSSSCATTSTVTRRKSSASSTSRFGAARVASISSSTSSSTSSSSARAARTSRSRRAAAVRTARTSAASTSTAMKPRPRSCSRSRARAGCRSSRTSPR